MTLIPRLCPPLLLLAACSGASPGTPLGSDARADAPVAQSTFERDTAPVVSLGDKVKVMADAANFAWSLHQQLRTTQGNLIYSPLSIQTALAMTYAGARAETETQMASALHFDLPQHRIHAAMNWLDLELNSRAASAPANKGQPFELRVVNALWGQEGHMFEQDYLDTIGKNYGSGIRLMDFAGASDASRTAINDWVSDSTEGRIVDLVPPSAVTPATTLILTNAVYFLAAWHNPFKLENTIDATFSTPTETITVPTMRRTEALTYAKGDGVQLVSLPYLGQALDMVFVLPDADRFDEIESGLTGDGVTAMLEASTPTLVSLSLPRFQASSSLSLAQALKALGMTNAFLHGTADFSGIDGTQELSFDDVLHKGFVKVDENGTEAAASTAAVPKGASFTPPVPLAFDRPFLFFVRDIETGSILFIGRIVDPR